MRTRGPRAIVPSNCFMNYPPLQPTTVGGPRAPVFVASEPQTAGAGPVHRTGCETQSTGPQALAMHVSDARAHPAVRPALATLPHQPTGAPTTPKDSRAAPITSRDPIPSSAAPISTKTATSNVERVAPINSKTARPNSHRASPSSRFPASNSHKATSSSKLPTPTSYRAVPSSSTITPTTTATSRITLNTSGVTPATSHHSAPTSTTKRTPNALEDDDYCPECAKSRLRLAPDYTLEPSLMERARDKLSRAKKACKTHYKAWSSRRKWRRSIEKEMKKASPEYCLPENRAARREQALQKIELEAALMFLEDKENARVREANERRLKRCHHIRQRDLMRQWQEVHEYRQTVAAHLQHHAGPATLAAPTKGPVPQIATNSEIPKEMAGNNVIASATSQNQVGTQTEADESDPDTIRHHSFWDFSSMKRPATTNSVKAGSLKTLFKTEGKTHFTAQSPKPAAEDFVPQSFTLTSQNSQFPRLQARPTTGLKIDTIRSRREEESDNSLAMRSEHTIWALMPSCPPKPQPEPKPEPKAQPSLPQEAVTPPASPIQAKPKPVPVRKSVMPNLAMTVFKPSQRPAGLGLFAAPKRPAPQPKLATIPMPNQQARVLASLTKIGCSKVLENVGDVPEILAASPKSQKDEPESQTPEIKDTPSNDTEQVAADTNYSEVKPPASKPVELPQILETVKETKDTPEIPTESPQNSADISLEPKDNTNRSAEVEEQGEPAPVPESPVFEIVETSHLDKFEDEAFENKAGSPPPDFSKDQETNASSESSAPLPDPEEQILVEVVATSNVVLPKLPTEAAAPPPRLATPPAPAEATAELVTPPTPLLVTTELPEMTTPKFDSGANNEPPTPELAGPATPQASHFDTINIQAIETSPVSGSPVSPFNTLNFKIFERLAKRREAEAAKFNTLDFAALEKVPPARDVVRPAIFQEPEPKKDRRGLAEFLGLKLEPSAAAAVALPQQPGIVSRLLEEFGECSGLDVVGAEAKFAESAKATLQACARPKSIFAFAQKLPLNCYKSAMALATSTVFNVTKALVAAHLQEGAGLHTNISAALAEVAASQQDYNTLVAALAEEAFSQASVERYEAQFTLVLFVLTDTHVQLSELEDPVVKGKVQWPEAAAAVADAVAMCRRVLAQLQDLHKAVEASGVEQGLLAELAESLAQHRQLLATLKDADFDTTFAQMWSALQGALETVGGARRTLDGECKAVLLRLVGTGA